MDFAELKQMIASSSNIVFFGGAADYLIHDSMGKVLDDPGFVISLSLRGNPALSPR